MPGPMFGSMSNKAYQAHIALSEPMTNTDQQRLSLVSSATSSSVNTHFKLTFGSLTLSHIWWEAVTNNAGIPVPGGEVSVTSPSNMRSGPHYQPKEKTWNPTNHTHGPSTANQTNHSCHLIQKLLPGANLKSLLFNS